MSNPHVPRSSAPRPIDEGTRTLGRSQRSEASEGRWFVMVRDDFFGASKNPLTKLRHLKMSLIMDEEARENPFLALSNDELAARYGCSPRYAGTIILEMEHAGELGRVMRPGKKDVRIGILLFRRAACNQPVAHDEESTSRAVAGLMASRSMTGPVVVRSTKPSTSRSTKPSTSRSTKPSTLLRSLSKKREEEQNRADSSQRQRLEDDQTQAEPITQATGNQTPVSPLPPPQVQPPPQAVAPSEPQAPATQPACNFIADLTPDQRARFDGWSPGKRAQASEMASHGLLRSVLKELSAPSPPAMPPPNVPTPELIAKLSGPMGSTILSRCASAIMTTLGDRGAKSFGTINHLCGEVVQGTRDPDSLAVPLKRTLEALAAGKAIKKPAGYWMRGVQNFDREKIREASISSR